MPPYSKKPSGGRGFHGGNRGGGGGGQQKNGGGGGGSPGGRAGQNRGGGGGNRGGGGGGKPNGQPQQGVKGSHQLLNSVVYNVLNGCANDFFDGNVLQLNRLTAHPHFAAVSAAIDFNSKAFCDSLCQAIASIFVNPPPSFISVDDNGIVSLHHLLEAFKKAKLHDCIKGLSAASNKIKELGDLSVLRHFPYLQELLLRGNPCADRNDYVKTVRKMLGASLVGLDGEPLVRAGLSLPFPLRVDPEGDALQLLQHIESTFFQAVTQGGISGALTSYHTHAQFSLTIVEEVIQVPNSGAKNVQRAFSDLKVAQRDNNRNTQANSNGNPGKIAKGRAAVGAALLKCLYPQHVQVEHVIDGSPNVVLLQAGVKHPVAVISLHGTMRWRHEAQSATDPHLNAAHFDRTMSLVLDNGAWAIVNDALHLRRVRNAGDAIVWVGSKGWCEARAKKFKVDANVIHALAPHCPNEAALDEWLNDIKLVPLEMLNACAQFAGGDMKLALMAARVIGVFKVVPEAAVGAVRAANGDLKGVSGILEANYNAPQFLLPR